MVSVVSRSAHPRCRLRRAPPGGGAWRALCGSALGLLVATGCLFPFEYEGRACAVEADCLEGYTCAAGTCLSAARTRESLTAPTFCDELYPTDQELTDDAALLGSLLPLTGPSAERGQNRREAIYLAVDEINDVGGLDGRALFVLSCDSATDVAQATAAAQFLGGYAGVPATIGAAASEVTIRSFNDGARDLGMLMMSPSSTSPAITGQSDLLWRTAPSDASQGLAIGALLLDRGFERVVVAHVEDAYGTGLRDVVRAAYCVEGPTDNCVGTQRFTARSFGAAADDGELASVVQAVVTLTPDAVVLVGQLDHTVRFLTEAVTTALEDVPFVLPDAAKNDLLDDVPSDVLKAALIGTAPAIQVDAVYGAFESAYEGRTQLRPAPTYTAHSYDATWLLAYALGAAEEGADGAAVRDQLRRLSAGQLVAAGPTGFVSSLRTLKGDAAAAFDFDGASGPLDFGEATEAPADVGAWYFDVAAARVQDYPGVIYDSATGTYTPPATMK